MSGQYQQGGGGGGPPGGSAPGGDTPPWLQAWQGRQGSQQDQHPWSGQMNRPGGDPRPGGGGRPQEPVRTQPTREAEDNREGIGRKVLGTSPLHEKWEKPQDLMQANPSEVGRVLLELAREHLQAGMFYPEQCTDLKYTNVATEPNAYPVIHKAQIESVIAEGFGWLQAEGKIARALGINGANGWMVITREGMKELEAEDKKAAQEADAQAKKDAARIKASEREKEGDRRQNLPSGNDPRGEQRGQSADRQRG